MFIPDLNIFSAWIPDPMSLVNKGPAKENDLFLASFFSNAWVFLVTQRYPYFHDGGYFVFELLGASLQLDGLFISVTTIRISLCAMV
jgi:hypothetical protein